jgi:glutamate racemase
MNPSPDAPIGLFDSGVGGLAILDHVHRNLPHEDLIYVADQAHVPYGPRPLAQVRSFSEEICRFLLRFRAKLVVVACNTASAASLQHLRATFPETPFVGMEPAVKPAALVTGTGHIGVLATPATFEGELFASVVARFAQGVEVHQSIAPGLVERIEAGDLTGPETRALLRQAVEPLLKFPIDTLVLGCTHYPFILPLLEELAGEVRVIDPSPAIANQVESLLAERRLLSGSELPGRVRYVTSAERMRFERQVDELIGLLGDHLAAHWSNGELHLDQEERGAQYAAAPGN